jgi:hypothetical protein
MGFKAGKRSHELCAFGRLWSVELYGIISEASHLVLDVSKLSQDNVGLSVLRWSPIHVVTVLNATQLHCPIENQSKVPRLLSM